MKEWTLALLVAGVSAFGLASAAGCGTGAICDPCCPTFCDPYCGPCMDPCRDGQWSWGFEGIGEFLYIRPDVCDHDYAIADDAPLQTPAQQPNGHQRGVSMDYKPGFRAGLSYVHSDGCQDITLLYTGLWATERKSVVPQGTSGVWATFGDPRYLTGRFNNSNGQEGGRNALALGRLRTSLNVIDLEAASRRMACYNIWVRRFVGLRWADILVRQAARYEGTVQATDLSFSSQAHDVRSRTHVWGIGPRIGADFRLDLCWGVGLGMEVGASLLSGESTFDTQQRDVITPLSSVGTAQDQRLHVTQYSHSRVFPELDARLGINYLWCCGNCLSFFVEVGYEIDSYINAIGRFRFDDDFGTNRETCDSFNLDGLYVNARVAF
jgi:hypothetical protein